MRVIVMIHGREAIPVRAIPFLTNWGTMSPDIISKALAHTDDIHWDYFFTLFAFRLEGSKPEPIKASWWENFPCRSLSAISAALRAQQDAGELTREQAYIEWRRQSLFELPAGAFVWKDEFLCCYSKKYSPESITSIRNGRELSWDERVSLYELEFEPYILDADVCLAIMDGFTLEEPESPSAAVLEIPVSLQHAAAEAPKERVLQAAIQEAAILRTLQERGYDPKALPVASPGRAGVKAEIRAAIAVPPAFVSRKTFDDAWQRMRGHGDIADAS